MSHYDLNLAYELATVADSIASAALSTVAQERMRLYLALLSIELTLKAMLERAGVPIEAIRARSHNIKQLLLDLDSRKIELEFSEGVNQVVSASLFRDVAISTASEAGTIGQLIDGLDQNLSVYPNEIRYGSHLKHFSPDLVLVAALNANAFAHKYWHTLR